MRVVLLHVGGDVIVPIADVVLILEAPGIGDMSATRDYLGRMQASGRLENLSKGEPKSVIICIDAVYVSPISASTLRRRAGQIPGQIA